MIDSRVTRARMDDEYEQTLMFQKNTDLLAQMNESYNANVYLQKSLTSEKSRVGEADTRAKRELYRLRQKAMFTDYMANYYDMASGAVIMTLYVTLLLLFPVALWKAGRISHTQLFILDGVLLALYAVVMVALFAKTGGRRKTAWKQYYWTVDKNIAMSQGTTSDCPAPLAPLAPSTPSSTAVPQ